MNSPDFLNSRAFVYLVAVVGVALIAVALMAERPLQEGP